MSELTAENFRALAEKIESEVGRVIVGQNDVVRHVLVSILAGTCFTGRCAWTRQDHVDPHARTGIGLEFFADPIHQT